LMKVSEVPFQLEVINSNEYFISWNL
jgi:hypothetical protein